MFGFEIRSVCQRLEGVDISKRMLQVAEQKNIYDKLTHKNIIDFLCDTELNFDYFVAADVFEYIGDLSEIFNLVSYRAPGHKTLIFQQNITKQMNIDWKILDGIHTLKVILKSCVMNLATFFLSHFEITKLRKEMHSVLDGGIYILETKLFNLILHTPYGHA